jgi:hypothetical protein
VFLSLGVFIAYCFVVKKRTIFMFSLTSPHLTSPFQRVTSNDENLFSSQTRPLGRFDTAGDETLEELQQGACDAQRASALSEDPVRAVELNRTYAILQTDVYDKAEGKTVPPRTFP